MTMQDAQTTTAANAPLNVAPTSFEFVLVKTRIGRRKVERLQDAGIPIVERSATRMLELRDRHIAQRGEAHYTRLGERQNATKMKLGDSGTLRIEYNPDRSNQGGPKPSLAKAIRMDKITNDLLETGHVLSDVHILQRSNDSNGAGFLVLVFKTDEPEAELSGTAGLIIEEILDLAYRTCYVWQNPDGSATVNGNAPLTDGDLSQVTDTRTLRLSRDEEDRFHWSSSFGTVSNEMRLPRSGWHSLKTY